VSYLLDTNVVSEMSKPEIDRGVLRFLQAAEEDSLHVSVVTLAELHYGIERLPAGQRRARLAAWFEEDLLRRFEGRIFLMDASAAAAWGALKAQGEKSGHPISDMDAWIAATAKIHGLAIVTRNVGDFHCFDGKLMNPWS